MNNTVSAQARIRWAKNLVEFMYFLWIVIFRSKESNC